MGEQDDDERGNNLNKSTRHQFISSSIHLIESVGKLLKSKQLAKTVIRLLRTRCK